jgi:DNA ligase-1
MRRISSISGDGSEHRKNVILRGLFLDASPLEGKFIARTALRNMQAGMGHKTILSALCQAFNYKSQEIQRAYNLMPDPGSIAYASMHRKLQEITIRPTQPIKPMFIRPGKAIIPGAFLPKYPGLRVQVHEVKKEIFVFTSRLRNITKVLESHSFSIGEGHGDFIIDADLIGLQEGRICSQAEMVKYINRRRLSRKSNISPVLMAYDLMYQGSKDLTGQAYKERHKRLLDVLGEPKLMPFIGISPAEERVFHEKEPLDDYLRMVQNAGGKGLMGRNLEAAYFPGSFSDQDFIIKLA